MVYQIVQISRAANIYSQDKNRNKEDRLTIWYEYFKKLIDDKQEIIIHISMLSTLSLLIYPLDLL